MQGVQRAGFVHGPNLAQVGRWCVSLRLFVTGCHPLGAGFLVHPEYQVWCFAFVALGPGNCHTFFWHGLGSELWDLRFALAQHSGL